MEAVSLVSRFAIVGLLLLTLLCGVTALKLDEEHVIATESQPSRTLQDIPASWLCPSYWYNDGENCQCECGAVDPDCSLPDVFATNCRSPTTKCSAEGLCDYGEPDSWTCDRSFYNTQDGCDCECGAYDPDCDLPGVNAPYICGCGFRPADECLQFCDVNGHCATWDCDDAWYEDGSICDCHCGTHDPDCDIPEAPIRGCPSVLHTCSAAGDCEINVPDDWYCVPSTYSDGQLCNCECGHLDPDCENSDLPVGNCAPNKICNAQGYCDTKAPPEWVCSDTVYDTGGPCDCGCGAYDPDCADPEAVLFNCFGDDYSCNSDGECVRDIDIPPEWTCSEAFYSSNDGCDCNCGIRDPDCDLPDQNLFGCCNTGGGDDVRLLRRVLDVDCGDLICNADGECELPPQVWTCETEKQGDGIACDCNCGDYDPDCHNTTLPVLNCPDPQATCNELAKCDIPSGWSCSPGYYNAHDGCDCECGAYDPDCDDEGAELHNCRFSDQICGTDSHCHFADVELDKATEVCNRHFVEVTTSFCINRTHYGVCSSTGEVVVAAKLCPKFIFPFPCECDSYQQVLDDTPCDVKSENTCTEVLPVPTIQHTTFNPSTFITP